MPSAKYFLDEARASAVQSELYHRHGCVIVTGGKIVARGTNRYVTTVDGSGRHSVHAEEDAIKKVMARYKKENLSSLHLYVVRVANDNSFKNSKPCKNCRNLITWLAPSKVCYTVDERTMVVENFKRIFD